MADASRFPSLAVPFAIVGGVAGWLSASLIKNPLIGYRVSPGLTAIAATGVAVIVGLVIKKLCVGRRYDYEIGEPDPDLRPASDRGAIHAAVVVVGGALTGAITALVGEDVRYVHGYALSGAVCSLAFVPVCLAVIAAARRAQRARLGSIVAGADRRAVWGILALALAVTTLEALPQWPAFADIDAPPPIAAVLAVMGAAAVTIGVLRADRRAMADAEQAIGPGLTAREEPAPEEIDPSATRVDLGLGDALHERLARGAAAYRDRGRTIALVQGSPGDAILALERAARRGKRALFALAAIALAHGAATTSHARVLYEQTRCTEGDRAACVIAAELVQDSDPRFARVLRMRAERGF